ncbi:hypothetical protein [Streptacidiphilus sp. EB129]|uniref:hypothetical protein n=1 Tax=Streptacidiphilus sp. EB129 TaxID=3156262 RepID=UPI003515DE4C
MDSGLGTDVGDHPEQALPGDIVVTYAGPGGTKSHTGLVDTAATATTEPTVDAHNNARLQYGYHYYAPSHLVRLVPNALEEVWAWAAEQELVHGTPTQPAPTAPTGPQKLLRSPVMSDPAGPQV